MKWMNKKTLRMHVANGIKWTVLCLIYYVPIRHVRYFGGCRCGCAGVGGGDKLPKSSELIFDIFIICYLYSVEEES